MPRSDIRASLDAYMKKHGLSRAAMARHAGVPLPTLKSILADSSLQPKAATSQLLRDAMRRSPPRRPEPRGADIVRDNWGRMASQDIGRKFDPPVSGARVRKIAKVIGLPADPRTLHLQEQATWSQARTATG